MFEVAPESPSGYDVRKGVNEVVVIGRWAYSMAEGLSRLDSPGHAWIALIALGVFIGFAFSTSGRFTPVEVNNTSGYKEFPFDTWEQALTSIRTDAAALWAPGLLAAWFGSLCERRWRGAGADRSPGT